MVRTYWNANTGYLEKPPAGMERKPEGLDWDAALGWLPKIPWDPKRYFNRFAYWDFSTGGQTGGLFVHLVDVVHWYLGLTRARSAVALGGIYLYNDGRDTADNINGIVEYPDNLVVTFEATLTDMIDKESVDICFHGTGGRLSIFRQGYRFTPGGTRRAGSDRRHVARRKRTWATSWNACVRASSPMRTWFRATIRRSPAT